MKIIEVADDIYEALSKRVQGFNESPSDVIARILNEEEKKQYPSSVSSPLKQNGSEPLSEIAKLLSSPGFLRSDAVDRYFAILAFLYRKSSEKFGELEFYRRKGGRRVNFSKEIQKIEQSGNSTLPKRIPGTPFYALSNLDNKSKRSILGDILPSFGYSSSDVRMIQREIPDSGISRSKRFH